MNQQLINAELLKKMSHSELVDLAKLMEQQERAYDSMKAQSYVPHELGQDGGQLAFHKSGARIRLAVTGNRFGKSTMGWNETQDLANGTHKYHPIDVPNRGKLYGESYNWINEVLVPKIEEWTPRHLLDKHRPFEKTAKGQICGINWAIGSYTAIGVYEQQTGKSEGSNWHYVGFDEPPKRELYIANLRGCIDYGGLMWFTMTPLREAWIFDELWKPGLDGTKPFIHCFRGTTDDNPHLNQESKDLFVSELTQNEKEVRFYGHFSRLQGLVINTYEPMMSDIDPFIPDENYVIYEGIDPHPRKPHAVLYKAIDRNGYRYVVDEISCEGGVADLARAMNEKRDKLTSNGAQLLKSVADTSLRTPDPIRRGSDLYNELKKELRLRGESLMPIPAKKRENFEATLNKVKDLYRTVSEVSDKLPILETIDKDKPVVMQYICKNCELYKNELLHYQWPESDLDAVKPIAKHNEYIDCDRYIESLAPTYRTPGSRFLENQPVGVYQRIIKNEKNYQEAMRA